MTTRFQNSFFYTSFYMIDISSIVRPNILELSKSSVPTFDNLSQDITVHLDANENPFNAPHNRYTPNNGQKLKNALGKIKGIWPHCIALSNGTDEAIDFIFRVFCIPGQNNVVAIEPTTRRYANYAQLNDIEYRAYLLNDQFQLLADEVLSCCDERTKVIFLCSPNNPTGNLLNKEELLQLCERFNGIVVVDEAYLEFSYAESMVKSLAKHHNLIVVNTLSKAYASADLHVSAIYAIPEIIRYIKTITPHHHINKYTEEKCLEILSRRYEVDKWIHQLLEERRKVMTAIKLLPICEAVYPSNANFFLVRFKNGNAVYEYLQSQGIAVYNCNQYPHCENCLRITVGLPHENSQLIGALRKFIIPR